MLISEDLTVYNFDYTAVDGKPEVLFICLKRLVGERGFEPPTPWSRTRSRTFRAFCGFSLLQVLDNASVGSYVLNTIEV
jgi:hypothetical protein